MPFPALVGIYTTAMIGVVTAINYMKADAFEATVVFLNAVLPPH